MALRPRSNSKYANKEKTSTTVMEKNLPFNPPSEEVLNTLLDELEQMDERLYSTLTDRERKICEMWMYRVIVDKNGKRPGKGADGKQIVLSDPRTLLVVTPWAKAFIKACNEGSLTGLTKLLNGVKVYEDEPMKQKSLDEGMFEPTGQPMLDAINSLLEGKYYAVRNYVGRPCIYPYPSKGEINNHKRLAGFMEEVKINRGIEPLLPVQEVTKLYEVGSLLHYALIKAASINLAWVVERVGSIDTTLLEVADQVILDKGLILSPARCSTIKGLEEYLEMSIFPTTFVDE